MHLGHVSAALMFKLGGITEKFKSVNLCIVDYFTCILFFDDFCGKYRSFNLIIFGLRFFGRWFLPVICQWHYAVNGFQ